MLSGEVVAGLSNLSFTQPSFGQWVLTPTGRVKRAFLHRTMESQCNRWEPFLPWDIFLGDMS